MSAAFASAWMLPPLSFMIGIDQRGGSGRWAVPGTAVWREMLKHRGWFGRSYRNRKSS